jgi:2-polyprenyl-3-methyl-5-hydroxy-6-metoxy-1,4-benzoquinol methylase
MTDLECPVCQSGTEPFWTLRGVMHYRCNHCFCIYRHSEEMQQFNPEHYERDYHKQRGHGETGVGIESVKRRTFSHYLNKLNNRPKTPLRLLEVGCGLGDSVAAACDMGFNAIGIDISQNAVSQAGKRFPQATFLCAQAEEMEYPDSHFDAVLMFDMIEHVADPLPLARNISRMLKPAGRVLIVTPDSYSWSSRLLKSRWFHAMDEHLLLHSIKSCDILFYQTGLQRIHSGFAWKWINLEMLLRHAKVHKQIFGSRFISTFLGLVPQKLRALAFPFNIGEFFAIYQKEK